MSFWKSSRWRSGSKSVSLFMCGTFFQPLLTAEEFYGLIAVELHRFLALHLVQLIVLGYHGHTKTQETRRIVGITRRIPAQVSAGFGGADSIFLLQQPRIDMGQVMQIESSVAKSQGGCEW
jgi:hypothetical protein